MPVNVFSIKDYQSTARKLLISGVFPASGGPGILLSGYRSTKEECKLELAKEPLASTMIETCPCTEVTGNTDLHRYDP